MSIVATTSFGPQSALLLHHLTKLKGKDIYLLYIKDDRVDESFKSLLMEKFVNNYNHIIYCEARPEPSKVEAMLNWFKWLHAGVWLTGIRKSQTQHRETQEMIQIQHDVLKVCPFFDWDDTKVIQYLLKESLPYKQLPNDKTECGIHLDYQI